MLHRVLYLWVHVNGIKIKSKKIVKVQDILIGAKVSQVYHADLTVTCVPIQSRRPHKFVLSTLRSTIMKNQVPNKDT